MKRRKYPVLDWHPRRWLCAMPRCKNYLTLDRASAAIYVKATAWKHEIGSMDFARLCDMKSPMNRTKKSRKIRISPTQLRRRQTPLRKPPLRRQERHTKPGTRESLLRLLLFNAFLPVPYISEDPFYTFTMYPYPYIIPHPTATMLAHGGSRSQCWIFYI